MVINTFTKDNIIIYNTEDGKAKVILYAKDGNVWMSQNQLAELFATSVSNISMHISNILKDNELQENSVVKNYLTTINENKLKTMGYIVNSFLDIAEDMVKHIHLPMVIEKCTKRIN